MKTYNGKIVDMNAIRSANENTLAVGNVRMNARGDLLDNKGAVKQTAADKSKEHYRRTVQRTDQTASLKGDLASEIEKDNVVEEEVKPQQPTKKRKEIINDDDSIDLE